MAKKICLSLSLSVVLLVLFSVNVFASSYPSYVISDSDRAMRVPEPYSVEKVISLAPLSKDSHSAPSDIFIDSRDNIYVVEKGQNRVLKMSKDGNITLVIGEGLLSEPGGVFADNDYIYVADSANKRIAVFNTNGEYIKEIVRPVSNLLEDDFEFTPEKLIVDDRGYFYVVCKGNENGLLMIDSKNEFRGFFGANVTQVSLMDIIIRAIYTRQQRSGKLVTLPFSYINVGINDGYIYTATTGAKIDQIRRLGPSGSDASFGAEHKNFKDLSLTADGKEQNFVDFAVDKTGNLIVLEETYGKIYQYDRNGKMIFAFGQIGVKRGNFLKPSSIAVDSNNNLYITDSERNNITVFKPTDFTNKVNIANKLYNDGEYDKAYSYWQEVLKSNNHYEIAQQAMGYILLRKEDYKAAMDKFYQANDKGGYATAFEEQRAIDINKNFPVIVLVTVIAIILIFILLSILRKRRKNTKPKDIYNGFHPFKMAWQTMWHPFDTLGTMKYRKSASYLNALALVFAYIIVRIICVIVTSFLFRKTSIPMTDWVYEIALAAVPWLLLSISNYGICTLADGEGKLKEVIVSGSYALAPFIYFSIPLAILTNIFSLSEAGFLKIAQTILFILCIFIVYAIHQEIHNLTVGKTIWIGILTVVGAMLVGYLLVLFYGLLVQVVDFIVQIMKEVSLLAF